MSWHTLTDKYSSRQPDMMSSSTCIPQVNSDSTNLLGKNSSDNAIDVKLDSCQKGIGAVVNKYSWTQRERRDADTLAMPGC